MAHPSVRVYYVVFAVLLVLLALTVAVAHTDLGRWGFPIALAIASIKAVLIMLYFMHVRYASPLTQLFACAGFVWLAIMLGLSASDYLSRDWATFGF